MSNAIAAEARSIVREAAGRPSGLIVKGQIRQAARNLGYPADSWRVREAWYGRAGSWSAQAVCDLQGRFITWRERETARADADLAARDLALLENARAARRAELELVDRQIAACREALRVAGPDTDRGGPAGNR